MQIKLNDTTTLDVVNVNGQSTYFQGANRDSLEFHFIRTKYTFDALDKLFTESNCKRITLINEREEFVHDNYVLRTKAEIRPVEITAATSETPAVMEDHIIITMAQKTYAEIQIENLQSTVDTLVLSSL